MNELFAEVISREETNEGGGRILDAINDGFFPNNLVGFDQRDHVVDEFAPQIHVVTDDESLHADSLTNDFD